MTSDVKKDWNKAKDTATYYTNRTESKIDEATNAIKSQYGKSDLKVKVDNIRAELVKDIEKAEPYWR